MTTTDIMKTCMSDAQEIYKDLKGSEKALTGCAIMQSLMLAEQTKTLKDLKKAQEEAIKCIQELCELVTIHYGEKEVGTSSPARAENGSEPAVPKKEDLEEKPKMVDLNSKAKIADIANGEQKEQTKAATDSKPMAGITTTPMTKTEKDFTSSLEPEQGSPEYYKSDKWKNKILDSSEMDDTWTDRMIANKELSQYFQALGNFLKQGIQGNHFTMDWVNQKVSLITQGHVKEINGALKDTVPPKLVKVLFVALKKAYMDEHGKKAA